MSHSMNNYHVQIEELCKWFSDKTDKNEDIWMKHLVFNFCVNNGQTLDITENSLDSNLDQALLNNMDSSFTQWSDIEKAELIVTFCNMDLIFMNKYIMKIKTFSAVQKKLKDKGYWNLFEISVNNVLYILNLASIVDELPHYRDVNVILVGSSYKDGFNSSGAFVGQIKDSIPTSVSNLLYYINVNFYNERDPFYYINNQYKFDLHSKHSKKHHGVLFINVCLDLPAIWPYDGPENEVAKFTIRFINKIMKQKNSEKKKICVLDMRLDMHAHITDKLYYSQIYRLKDDIAFKLKNEPEYHALYRLQHPGHAKPNSDDAEEYSEIFLKIKFEFAEIASIYRCEETCYCKHLDRAPEWTQTTPES